MSCYLEGGSYDFQPSFRGVSLSFVPNGRGGHVFSNHHIFKCSVLLLIGQFLNSELIMPDMKVGGKCFKDTERRGSVQVHGTRRKRLHGNPAVCFVICSAKAQFKISVCACKEVVEIASSISAT